MHPSVELGFTRNLATRFCEDLMKIQSKQGLAKDDSLEEVVKTVTDNMPE